VTPLILTVLTASLLGSLHCAGMCGAFVTFAVTGGAADAATQARLHAAYNLGRLVVYVLLGVSAGALGAALDLAGALVGLQRAAAVSAGAIMVAAGILTILRLRGVRLAGLGVPKGFERWLTAGHRLAAKQTPMLRAASIGLLTTLLPCGWLYAFVVTAAGTADPVKGGVTMAVFWVGTLPMLIAVGTLARRATGALGSKLPTITAVAVIVVGLVTVVDRAGLVQLTPRMLNDATVVNVANTAAPSSSDLPCCHERP
jgi:hypothetical protein